VKVEDVGAVLQFRAANFCMLARNHVGVSGRVEHNVDLLGIATKFGRILSQA